MKAVKAFFFPDTPAREFAAQWRALSETDRAQLQAGIEGGSLTY